MTCIVELICRGNIENIDNNKFKLVSRDNLLDYEEQLINLIFNKKTTISFSEINKKFLDNNKGTSVFVEQFKQIKEKILDRLFALKIYSIKGEMFLKHIRIISLLIYVNICVLIINIVNANSMSFILIFVINIITLLLIKFLIYVIKGNKIIFIIKGKTGGGFALTFSLMILLITSSILLIYAFKQHFIILIMIMMIIILNTIILLKSKLHILTKKGKDEYTKVYGLKSYILDFSLMSERDVDSTIIWDDYLAYAVAFSIPNKIMDRFKSGLMKSNIILQNIDKFINF